MPGKSTNIAGLILVSLLSLAVVTLFYGNLFGKLNQVSFSAGGDGLQSLVNMEYHIRYDTTYMRCNSMNYPYGEHVFFTNNQPLISNTIKFISQNITDISDFTLGILNFLMLFCLVVTPVLLYLVFSRLGIGLFVAIVASLAITFLSPQTDRLGGHFNLSYICAIPWMMLLLLSFFRKPTLLLSALIFLTMMAGALTHFYWYGFFALLLVFLYGAYLLNPTPVFRNRTTLIIHLVVQLVLPFLILQAFYISDQVTDRPSYPWGFLYYRSYLQSVFLPLGKPYGQFLHAFVNTGHIDWEGYAFVGMVAFMGTLFFVVRFVNNLVRKRFGHLWQAVSDKNLNILFWASFAGLLYSFGLPFILGMEWLVDLIGPVRQMRGIARFAWVFYYVMNVVTIYWLWNWWKTGRHKWTKAAVIAVALLILCTDAWYNSRNRGKWLENHIPAFTDQQLAQPENQWIRRININRYQAFIPLPYFHIGSENIWIDGGCDIVNQSFITIRQSGLPCMGVLLSRTSRGQTLENIALMLGTYNKVNTERFPSKKPFLLMVANCDLLNDHEKQLIRHATPVDSSGKFDIYELPFGAFQAIADSMAHSVENEFKQQHLYKHRQLLSTDSIKAFSYTNYDSLENGTLMFGSGYFSGRAKIPNELFNGALQHADTGRNLVVSCWLHNVSGDLYPRTRVTLAEVTPEGLTVNNVSHQVFKKITAIADNNALVEFSYRLTSPANRIILTLQNSQLRKKPLMADDLLIRAEHTDVYRETPGWLWKNNRPIRLTDQ